MLESRGGPTGLAISIEKSPSSAIMCVHGDLGLAEEGKAKKNKIGLNISYSIEDQTQITRLTSKKDYAEK